MMNSRKRAAGASAYALKIQPDLDVLYIGIWHDLAVYMVNDKNEQAQDMTVPFEIQLKYFKEDVPVPEHERVIQFETGFKPRQEFLLKNGVCHLKFQMHQLSRDLGNCEFALQFSCAQPPILVRTPHPIRVVKYKVEIKTNLPPLFFKDQGGQHNCMELLALLVDEAGLQPPRQRLESLARPGQFIAELLYESGEFVKEQTILSVKTLHVGLDGIITCRFRISDVSKRHLSQRFRIRIVPSVHLSPENNDIAGVVSSPVEVRSKQKKNEEKIYNNMQKGSRKRPEMDIAPLDQLREAIDAQVAGASAVPPQNKKLRGRGQWMDGDKVGRLGQVLEWCRASHALLEGLEWQLIGYELARDGSNNVDANLPLYRCPTCWEYKDRFRPPSAPPPRHHPQCPLSQHLHSFRDNILLSLDNLTEPGPEEPPSEEGTMIIHPGNANAAVKPESDTTDDDDDESTPLPSNPTPFRQKPSSFETPAIPPPPAPLPGELPDWSRSALRQESLRQPSFGDFFPSLSTSGLGREGSLSHFGVGALQPLSTNFSGGNELDNFYASSEPKKEESEDEVRVEHILVSPGSSLGHPAFDAAHTLIGFYQDTTGRSNEVASLSFTSFKRLPEDVRNSQQVADLKTKAEIAFKDQPASEWTDTPSATPSATPAAVPTFSRPLLVSRKTNLSAMKEQVVLAAYSVKSGDGAFAHMFAH